MKKFLKRNVWLCVPLLSIFFLNFDTTGDIRVDRILKQLAVYRDSLWQQKINLHTDKDVYMAGENIWIKSYLLNASSFMPDSVSKEIYIDLIDFNNRHVQSIILRNKGGFSQGNILIKDTLAEGNYQLRAYTNWMRNFDTDFFFDKTIRVVNPNYENVVTRSRISDIERCNKKVAQMQSDYTINFFPEGGDLVAGFKSRVAFKAENGMGNGIDVTGTLYSANGEKIIDFQSSHQGMGFFTFSPQSNEKYYAKVRFNKEEKEEKANIPNVITQGISMEADPFLPDFVRIVIRSNRTVSANIASNEIILVGQARGSAFYVSKGELKDKPIEVLVPKKHFPSGIVHFTVFDNRLEPACERLVFIDNLKKQNVNALEVIKKINSDSSIYTLKLTSKNGNPVKSNLSLSVSENPSGANIYKSNILTHLLLTSDLKGKIEAPSYYFTGKDEAIINLDLVMLTHGWRRFVWKDLLTAKFPNLKYLPFQGLSIEGRVTRDFFGAPVAGTKVRLSVLSSYNDVFETKTDSKGHFLFTNLDYEDTLSVKIEAIKNSGGNPGLIKIGDTIVPQITLTNAEIRNVNYAKSKLKENGQRERLILREKYRAQNREQSKSSGRIHERPTNVIEVGPDAVNYTSVFQYMQGKVPGLTITGNSIIIRGINTITGSTDPLFLLDGVPIDPSSAASMPPSDLATIEVLKGPEASAYGSRGGNGVIAFYSRRGEFINRGEIEFDMKGYHKVAEFYVPSAGASQYKPSDYAVPRTLYWAPQVITNGQGIATVRFPNAFKNENTQLTIEGLTSDGEIIYYNAPAK
ncbi:MAG TPA: TonB-dependent receptor plug domain-containing protein [Bacteroidales bacterium]|nr:TonB-dependent receptor plug domain-containing protein [Bacteroidales bacterium]